MLQNVVTAIAFFVSGPWNACGSATLRWDHLNLRSNHNYPCLQGWGFKETESPALLATALAIQARFILMAVQNLWNEKFVCKKSEASDVPYIVANYHC